MKKFEYNNIDKIKFYSSYIFYKFLVLFEVKKPKIKLFLIDIFYSLINLISLLSWKRCDLSKSFYKFCNLDYIETRFGKFLIKRNTNDAIVASPSFERRDVNFLIKKISEEIFNKRNVLFLDIGADFGYYSILLSNIFKNNELLKIYSFEPTSESRLLLEKNIELNNAKSIKIFPFAIYSDSNISVKMKKWSTGSSSISLDIKNNDTGVVKTRTIDSALINEINNFDVIFIKIDIEGFETEALTGAKKTLESNKKIYLMVEDFADNRIIDFLENTDATFVGKFNNYNSWWKFRV